MNKEIERILDKSANVLSDLIETGYHFIGILLGVLTGIFFFIMISVGISSCIHERDFDYELKLAYHSVKRYFEHLDDDELCTYRCKKCGLTFDKLKGDGEPDEIGDDSFLGSCPSTHSSHEWKLLRCK